MHEGGAVMDRSRIEAFMLEFSALERGFDEAVKDLELRHGMLTTVDEGGARLFRDPDDHWCYEEGHYVRLMLPDDHPLRRRTP